MSSGTNPFDDSFEVSAAAANTSRQRPTAGTTNPFDDDIDDSNNILEPVVRGVLTSTSSTNPFAVDEDLGSYPPIQPSTDDLEEEEDADNRFVGGGGGGDRVTVTASVDARDGNVLNTSAAAPAEASWQYLGDLPYRRVPIYSNVRWNRDSTSGGSSTNIGTTSAGAGGSNADKQQQQEDYYLFNHGLARFPPEALKQRKGGWLNRREIRALLNTTTITRVAGCPHGGPLAAVTLPVVANTATTTGTASSSSTGSSGFTQADLRILTNAGKPLAKISLPPAGLDAVLYAPSNVLNIGFTSRCILIVVYRDSLCLTYNLRGEAVLPPFLILPRNSGSSVSDNSVIVGTDLLQANIYEGGVAVLAQNKTSALVELLDDHDDPDYLQGTHITARRIVSSTSATNELLGGVGGGGGAEVLPPHYAIVTPLPTAEFAARNFCYFLNLAVLPRSRTNSRHPEVFLSTSDNSVVVVNAATTEITDVDCRARISSPIVDMSFAPNGRFLACFTEASMLTVISTSFETKVLDFDTSEGSSSPPLDMKWCGEDSVVLHWKNLGVLMVGPYGDWLRFPYEGTENVYIIPEIDCCRVITDSSVEILQRVPPATAQLLRIGSIETAAMLLDAADAFDSGSAASDEAARAIVKTGLLEEAIETCTDAATKEFDILLQKRLLRAASYGMHFSYKNIGDEDNLVMGGPLCGSDKENGLLPSYTTVHFVESAKKLRILNALRNPSVGFVLTCAQFDAITPTGVIARLVAMKRPALATALSKYLSLSKSIQLFARASKAAAYVEADRGHSDSETAEAAIRIINEDTDRRSPLMISSTVNRGGYATVALAANKVGRPGVANLLLMLESSVADKVPALISTGSYADAIAVATAARDADLIFATLMEYEKACLASASVTDISKAQSTFLTTVVTKFTPEAFHTLRRYLGTVSDVKSVTNLLLRAQRFSDAGAEVARRAMEENDSREKQGILAEASRIFGMGKDTAFHKSCTDDYLDLLKDQEVLRTKYGSFEVAPESSSVTATISSLIHYAASNVREQHRLLADAEKIAKKYRIPEKRLWHTKVRAFAESEQWSNLRILADSRAKPPIGYKPFARAVIKGKQGTNEILRYIERVSDAEERYDLLCEAALWQKALDEAVRLKDTRRILNVKTLCNNPEIQLAADQWLGRLA